MFYNLHVSKVLYLVTLFAGICVLAVSVFLLRMDTVPWLAIAGAVTLVLAWRSHIMLGRSRIFLTLSEVLVFLWLLSLGGYAATLIAAAEAGVAAYSFRRKSRDRGLGPVWLSASVGALATFGTAAVAERLFGFRPESGAYRNDAEIVLVLGTMLLTQFLIKSVFWTAFATENDDSGFWNIWYGRCLNGFALYVVGALGAGLFMRATFSNDPALVLATAFVGAVVFFTYKRYVAEIKDHYSRAERVERDRVEDARRHVDDLKEKIGRLEQTEQALRTSEARFRRAAYQDALTGLPNLNMLMLEIEKASARKRKTDDFDFALLCISLNGFSGINETLGHIVADRFLLAVAERLKLMLGEEDFLARITGGEFAILAACQSSSGGAERFAETIIGKLAAPVTVDGKILFTSVNLGIGLGEKNKSSADLLRDAKIAMYKAAATERPYALFDDEMYETALNRLQVESELQGAVERGEFEAFFQPIVELETMELAGFESLIRWRHPERGLLAPGEFIGVCEESGIVVPMTTWMLEESCSALARFQAVGRGRKIFVSVNLSAKDFGGDDLVERVAGAIARSGIQARCLKLEITESAIMENSENAVGILEDLKKLGVMLSVDDFGTGYSSLSYLHKFPVDTLKVDRSFVSSMEFGSENGEIVRTVITLAKLLGMRIISEGIESLHQLHQLTILECEYGQGHLFSKPVPEKEALEMVADTHRWRGLSPSQVTTAPPTTRPDAYGTDESRTYPN